MAERIAVAMSGGVDSSAAAWLMREQGYDLMGITLTLFDDTTANVPGNAQDAADAAHVAGQLGFPHHVLHMAEQFRSCVMDHFAASYEAGRTPNPCVVCNRWIKFGALLEQARILGADSIATGHYAQIKYDMSSARWLLKKAAHPEKDQSYVLCTLSQEQLASARFPLGGLSKGEIRQIALEQGLVNARKRESQDICFIPDGDYASFIRRHTGKEYPCGAFINENGVELKPGIHTLLEHLRENKLRTSIATSSPLDRTKEYLSQVGLVDAFDELVSGHMVEHGKPAPDIYIYAAEKLGLRPEECLVLEDSPTGLLAALRAGCVPVMVPDQDQPDEEVKSRIYAVAENLEAVIELLEVIADL